MLTRNGPVIKSMLTRNSFQARTYSRLKGLDVGRTEGRDVGRTEGRDVGRTEGRDVGRTEVRDGLTVKRDVGLIVVP